MTTTAPPMRSPTARPVQSWSAIRPIRKVMPRLAARAANSPMPDFRNAIPVQAATIIIPSIRWITRASVRNQVKQPRRKAPRKRRVLSWCAQRDNGSARMTGTAMTAPAATATTRANSAIRTASVTRNHLTSSPRPPIKEIWCWAAPTANGSTSRTANAIPAPAASAITLPLQPI